MLMQHNSLVTVLIGKNAMPRIENTIKQIETRLNNHFRLITANDIADTQAHENKNAAILPSSARIIIWPIAVGVCILASVAIIIIVTPASKIPSKA
jgi:hypothetical protein